MNVDEEVVGKLAELDIVMMDLERANGRIIELEKKNVRKEAYHCVFSKLVLTESLSRMISAVNWKQPVSRRNQRPC